MNTKSKNKQIRNKQEKQIRNKQQEKHMNKQEKHMNKQENQKSKNPKIQNPPSFLLLLFLNHRWRCSTVFVSQVFYALSNRSRSKVYGMRTSDMFTIHITNDMSSPCIIIGEKHVTLNSFLTSLAVNII